jgi:hypothetical protein
LLCLGECRACLAEFFGGHLLGVVRDLLVDRRGGDVDLSGDAADLEGVDNTAPRRRRWRHRAVVTYVGIDEPYIREHLHSLHFQHKRTQAVHCCRSNGRFVRVPLRDRTKRGLHADIRSRNGESRSSIAGSASDLEHFDGGADVKGEFVALAW